MRNWAYSVANPGNPVAAAPEEAGQSRQGTAAVIAGCQWESAREEGGKGMGVKRKHESQRGKLTCRDCPTIFGCCWARMVCLAMGAAAVRVWVCTTLASLLNEACCVCMRGRERESS